MISVEFCLDIDNLLRIVSIILVVMEGFWNRVSKSQCNILQGSEWRKWDLHVHTPESLSPLDDLSEFGSGFEFFIEEPRTLELSLMLIRKM